MPFDRKQLLALLIYAYLPIEDRENAQTDFC
jgi:hypothetical protein